MLTSWCHLPVSPDEPAWVQRDLDLHWHLASDSRNAAVRIRDWHGAVCSSYANTLQLLRRLRSFRPDLVYVWNLLGIGAIALLDLLNHVKVPWALHLMDRLPVEIAAHTSAAARGLFDAHGPALYARGRILAMSRHLLDEIETMAGITFPQGVDIVPGWADLADAVPHEPYLRDGTARFVSAGAIVPHKGIELILEAGARLRANGRAFTIDLFGDGDVAAYVDMARGLQLTDRVRFLGPRSQAELMRAYAGYDAFLFPTWEREPFGFAPVEAAGCGTPPIVTRHCGAAERLVDGVHCVKIDRTADALAEAMDNVASGAIPLGRIGRAGQRLVASDLSLDRCLDRIEDALGAHAHPWRYEAADDPKLPLLAFLKHSLSVSLQFG